MGKDPWTAYIVRYSPAHPNQNRNSLTAEKISIRAKTAPQTAIISTKRYSGDYFAKYLLSEVKRFLVEKEIKKMLDSLEIHGLLISLRLRQGNIGDVVGVLCNKKDMKIVVRSEIEVR